MFESQITLKLLIMSKLFLSSKRISKFLNTGKLIEVGKVIYSNGNYNKIKIIEDRIEQKQSVNDFIWRIEKVAQRKA